MEKPGAVRVPLTPGEEGQKDELWTPLAEPHLVGRATSGGNDENVIGPAKLFDEGRASKAELRDDCCDVFGFPLQLLHIWVTFSICTI